MKKIRVCVHRCSNSSARASHESIFSRERGSIVRKADVHSEFSTKREESISPLFLSLSLPQPCRFPFYPSLSGFPAMISDVRRRRPNGNVKVTWRRCVLVAVAYFSSTWNRYARIHLSYDTSIWERDQDRPTEPIPVNPAINYNRSRVRTFNVLQITVATVWRDYVRYQTRINYLSGE